METRAGFRKALGEVQGPPAIGQGRAPTLPELHHHSGPDHAEHRQYHVTAGCWPWVVFTTCKVCAWDGLFYLLLNLTCDEQKDRPVQLASYQVTVVIKRPDRPDTTAVFCHSWLNILSEQIFSEDASHFCKNCA